MIKFPKVAVCCPTYNGKNYCWDKWYEQYKNLTYPNKVLFVIDNSGDRKNYKALSKLGIKVEYINPKGKSIKQILAESHELCRQFALSCDADFMLHWESDMFNDKPDIIEQLVLCNKPVINTIYHIRTGIDREVNIMLIDTTDNQLHENRFAYYIGNDYVNFVDGTVKTCFAAGIGLCLIHKSVLKKIKFHYFKENDMLPDLIFANDIYNLGISNWVHTGIFSQHENVEWLKEVGDVREKK